jgi:hypothetical protein
MKAELAEAKAQKASLEERIKKLRSVRMELELLFDSEKTSLLKQQELARWFAGLFFDPEDGGAMFLRNVGCYTTDYTASYPRR